MIRGFYTLLLLCFITGGLYAQVNFRTLVSEGPVIVGESFQVQYVLENVSDNDEFIPPQFKYLRYISGPNIYVGSITTNNGTQNIRNVMYTLTAVKPGRFVIPGASVRVKGQLLRSDNAFVQAISRDEAIRKGLMEDSPLPSEDYYLRPNEDPYQKISKNLFIKVQVDRKNCFVGQPVTATFKLYSRLQSRSDIVKNPGFYGFTVQDMVGLDDRRLTKEVIGGKKFDVHTVRKVQLYPLRAGTYTIDPMEFQNRVDFSKSAVRKKTEQEIVEGLFDDPMGMGSFDNDMVSYETSMHTEPVTIKVDPVPEVNKPTEFNGATGRFNVAVQLDKSEVSKNEEGEFRIKISGKGNFTQLVAPSIAWPAGLEAFEPEVTDSLDHSVAPMQGTRIFRFRFISSKAGTYTVPAVSFSFFDPDSNRYKVVNAPTLTLIVNNQEKISGIVPGVTSTVKHKPVLIKKWMITGGVLLFLLVLLALWLLKKKKPTQATKEIKFAPGVHTLLYPASILLQGAGRTFYGALRKSIWNFFEVYFDLSGSGMNKTRLAAAMEAKKVTVADRQEVFSILDECEAGIFTDIDSKADQQQLLDQTRNLLERIKTAINA